jgi:hypothetical protein
MQGSEEELLLTLRLALAWGRRRRGGRRRGRRDGRGVDGQKAFLTSWSWGSLLRDDAQVVEEEERMPFHGSGEVDGGHGVGGGR